MARVMCAVLLLLACAVAASAQDTMVMAPGMAPMSANGVPVPAPMEAPMDEAPAEDSSEEAEAPPYYPPKPSAGTWFRWLPEDPMLLAGVIISFLSGLGFLFVIWTVFFELILGPFCMTLVDAYGSHKHKH